MNEFDPILDELVSAYVDGEATAAERARVESDPALLERAATFRGLREAIAADPPAVSDEQRRLLIARALAETPAPLAPVRSLAARRFSRVAPIAAAAACIAAFFAFATWLVSGQDTGDGDSASSAGAATTAVRDALSQAEMAPSAAGGSQDNTKAGPSTTVATAATTRAGAAPFLGAFADEVALRQALRDSSRLSAAPTSTVTAPQSSADGDAFATCAIAVPADATRVDALLRGRPVTALVRGTTAEVIDHMTCTRTVLDLAAG
jgi:hypothetical protein